MHLIGSYRIELNRTRLDKFGYSLLEESRQLRHQGGRVDDCDGLDSVRNRAEGLRPLRVADADVALDGEDDCQPDGCRVADGRHVQGQGRADVTPIERNVVFVMSKRVEVEEDGRRKQSSQHVRDRHGNDEEVCRTAHVLLQQNETDEGVRYYGEQNDYR